jgi:DNA polymerase-3 subunit delta
MDPLRPLLESLAQPASVYVLVGAESLLVRHAEAALRNAVLTGATAAFNDAVFTAGEESALSFADTAAQVPMMARKRLVVIRQIQEASAALLDAILAYLQSPVPSTVLAITGDHFPGATGGMNRGLRISNAVEKIGVVLKLDGKGVDSASFAQSKARELGVKMEPAAANTLVGLVGTELTVLALEVEKCASYVGNGGTITSAVVGELCMATVELEVWSLTNALVAKDKNQALLSLERLLEDGEAPHLLLGSVAWHLRQLVVVADCMKRGISEKEANIRAPWNVLKTIKETVARNPTQPHKLFEELAAANHKMNSSRAGDRRVFEALVLSLLL